MNWPQIYVCRHPKWQHEVARYCHMPVGQRDKALDRNCTRSVIYMSQPHNLPGHGTLVQKWNICQSAGFDFTPISMDFSLPSRPISWNSPSKTPPFLKIHGPCFIQRNSPFLHEITDQHMFHFLYQSAVTGEEYVIQRRQHCIPSRLSCLNCQP